MENRRFESKNEPEIVYSRAVKAGKRIYYLDVKKARNEDLYLYVQRYKKICTFASGVSIFRRKK